MTTNRDICTAALRKIGVAAQGEVLSAQMLDDALDNLGRMLRAWQNKRFNLWTYQTVTVPLTAAAGYIITPHPFEVHSARIVRNGTAMPMHQMTREEYESLPVKASTGFPTTFYVDRQLGETTVMVWPLLAAALGEAMELTVTRVIETGGANDDVDIPGEFEDAVVYGLAARLADDYEVPADRVMARAADELDQALAFDREGSVWFCGDEYREI